jgi:hypothetical protein
MSASENQHHHHHHHKKDGASLFKQKSLRAIERNKLIQKWLFRFLCILALVLFVIMVAVYML